MNEYRIEYYYLKDKFNHNTQNIETRTVFATDLDDAECSLFLYHKRINQLYQCLIKYSEKSLKGRVE